MRRILVSVRRADGDASYGRVLERLESYFGPRAVAPASLEPLDGAPAAPPASSPTPLAAAMADCAALLVLIGPQWLEARDAEGRRRLDDEHDPVRLQIEAALRQSVPILPVLVQGAAMPGPDELPASLRLLTEQGHHSLSRRRESLLALAGRTGLPVRPDPDFGGDAQRLCEIVEHIAGMEAADPQRATRARRRSLLGIALAGSGMLAAHGVLLAVAADKLLIPTGGHPANPTAFWVSMGWWAPFLDLLVYLLVGYFASRRAGTLGPAIVTALVVELVAIAVGIVAFGDITWARGPLILAPDAGAPGNPIGAQYLIVVMLAASGVPAGLVASIVCGVLGGSLGRSVRRGVTARRERQRYLAGRGAALGKLFISYRRADTEAICGSIYDRLAQFFGAENIFRDVDRIPIGSHFQRCIDENLAECAIQLVIIGPRWLTITGAEGRRRLDEPGDPVRLEIETALRLGVTVVPVLTQGATLPAPEELPVSLRPMLARPPLVVRYLPHFEDDMRIVAEAVRPAMWVVGQRQKQESRGFWLSEARVRRWLRLVWPVVLLLCGAALGYTISRVTVWSTRNASTRPDAFTLYALAASGIAILLLAGAGTVVTAWQTRRVGRAVGGMLLNMLAGSASMLAVIVFYGGALHARWAPADHTAFRTTAIGTVVAAWLTLLVPGLPLLFLLAWIGAHLPQRLPGWLRRRPNALQVSYLPQDRSAGERTAGALTAQFGGQVRAAEGPGGQPVALAGLLRSAVRRAGLGNVLPDQALLAPAERVARALRRCAGLVVFIGPGWADAGALAHLEEPSHPLRLHYEAARDRGLPIVPILLDGRTMPAADGLPATMRDLVMLNGAAVRSDPDFAGDMRRLNRILEQITGLRPAFRLRGDAALSWLIGGLATLALLAHAVVFDVQLVRYSALNDQVTPVLLQLGLFVIDCAVYALMGVILARRTGRVGLAPGIALVATVAATVAGDALLSWLAAHHGAPIARLRDTNATSPFMVAVFAYSYVVIVVQLIAAATLSWLSGALLGRPAYRGRERRLQERVLYASLLTASQRPSGASTSGVARQGAAALGTAGAAEAARRAEILAAQAAARKQRSARAGLRVGLVAAVALLVIASSGALGVRTYRAQVAGLGPEATIAAHAQGTATVVAHATATAAVYLPYTAAVPGPGCDTGPASWGFTPGAVFDCGKSVVTLSASAGAGPKIAFGFTWPDHPFVAGYTVEVDASSLAPGTCAGLMANEQPSGAGYDLDLCDDGSWGLVRVGTAASAEGVTALGSGQVTAQATNRLALTTNRGQLQASINGHQVASVQDATFPTTSRVDIFMFPDPSGGGTVSFSHFRYAPIH